MRAVRRSTARSDGSPDCQPFAPLRVRGIAGVLLQPGGTRALFNTPCKAQGRASEATTLRTHPQSFGA